MNFASLLRMHQNRQPVNHFGNQFMINCNRKNDTPIVYGGVGHNNYSGIKKRTIEPIEPSNQSLMEIYSNFQQNPHVQWILQLQSHKVKIHKFKPSKIKAKKEEPQHTQKFQSRLYPPQQRQFTHPITQIMAEDNQSDFIQQQNHHQVRERKNYSPMHQMKPKNFNQEQNWMQNLNQNKFSFGDDSQQVQQVLEQKINEGHQNVQNESQIENQSQLNAENQSYIEERQQYEIQQNTYKGREVNLMNQFQLDQNGGYINNGNKDLNIIINQPVQQKNQQQKIMSGGQDVGFNPNVGFSFDEIDKIGSNQQQNINTEKLNQNLVTPKPEDDQNKESPPTDRLQGASLNKQNNQVDPKIPLQIPKQKPKQNPITLINTDRENQQNQTKIYANHVSSPQKVEPQLRNDSNLRQRQSSPLRIYCKANVRNLTPQKFKYPRVDSKIHSNSNIQPFTTENNDVTTKNKTQTNIKVVDAKVEHVESQKLIIVPSSDRLLALIDQSKRLLESRNVNDDKKNEDRIRRIVLHQPPSETKITLKDATDPSKYQNQLEKNDQKKNFEKIIDQQQQKTLQKPKIQIETATKPQVLTQQQQKKLSQNLTPKKIQTNIPSVSSPKSPIQQKPKFFNQLANIQKNYTPERTTNISPYTRYTENTGTQKQTSQFVPSVNPCTQQIGVKNTEIGHQNYLQTNYTYKPLNLPPQQRPVEQKDTVTYKPQGYQPSLSPYQPIITQPYQPSDQTFSPITNLSNNQKPVTQPLSNQNPPVAQVKTYSPYFPINNATNTFKPSSVAPVQQNKTNQVYQTYTYSGFSTAQQNQVVRPLSSNETNNYIKINTNYVSPLQKYEKTQQKNIYQVKVNGDVAQKENLRPVGLGIEGIKCVESKIYEPKSITNLQSDPKETSVQFSLRMEEHFHLGTKLK